MLGKKEGLGRGRRAVQRRLYCAERGAVQRKWMMSMK
jgi:hypothetical protein